MSFLRSLFASSRDSGSYPPSDGALASMFAAGPTRAGVPVDENTALNYSAVWAATRLLSATGGNLPLNLYRKLPGGRKEVAEDHRVHRLLHDAPNDDMGAMMFRATRIAQQVNWGNCYATIRRDGAGRVWSLEPVHANRVRPMRDNADDLYYEVWDRGTTRKVAPEEIFHVPSILSDDGVCGKGVIRHARESIGLGQATERHGAAFFGNGARPSVVVKHPNKMSDTARKNFRDEWNEMHQGPDNAGKVALLQEGADITTLTIDPNDAQFLQTRQHNVEEIARWYGVPPHLIGHLLRSTFSNIEQQGLEFVTFSLIPWLVLWEQEIWRKLLTPDEQQSYYARHVVDALQRGDAKSRADAMQVRFMNGAMTQDEWREVEDMDPLPDDLGKKFYVPVNLRAVDEPPPEPAPDPGPAKPPPTGNAEAAGLRAAVVSTCRSLYLATWGRLVRKECEAARRAAKKPGAFLAWLDEFYPKHQELAAELLLPTVRTHLTAAGQTSGDANLATAGMAAGACAAARAVFLELAGDATAANLEEKVEAHCRRWETERPALLAEESMQCTNAS